MIRQYGVLAYRPRPGGEPEVLLITSRDTRRWVIPRGNIVAGLSPQETASREAFEEAGIAGDVAEHPVGTYRYRKRRKNRPGLLASVQVFPMRVTEQKADWPEKAERTLEWVDPREAARRVDEEGLKAIFSDFALAGDTSVQAAPPSLWPQLPSKGGWGMLRFFKAIMPKEDAFFDMFARQAEMLVGGADAMAALFSGEKSIEESCQLITDFEHKADDVTREVLIAVRRTFITPFDRSAITRLITSMDDAIDEMRQTAKAITLYDVTKFEPQMGEMSKLAGKAARLVVEAVPLLKSVGKNGARLDKITEKIVHLEGEADDLNEEGLKALYHAHGETSPMAFFVGRQVYIHLERVLDGFEDVADEIQGIVIDHA